MRYPFAVISVLAVYNVVANEVLRSGLHGALAAGTALILWATARRRGVTPADIALDKDDAQRGLRCGLGLALIVVLGVSVLATVPVTRSSFVDPAFVDRDAETVLWHVLVRIPVVTAAFEELAFRGFLLGALMGALSRARALTIHAVLFGLWHILPTHGGDTGWGDVAIAVGFTTLAGFFLAWLQLRTRSLLAPWIVHWAANGTTYTAAWLVTT